MTRKSDTAKARNVAYTSAWDKRNPERRKEIAARHRARAKVSKGLCPEPWCRHAVNCDIHAAGLVLAECYRCGQLFEATRGSIDTRCSNCGSDSYRFPGDVS